MKYFQISAKEYFTFKIVVHFESLIADYICTFCHKFIFAEIDGFLVQSEGKWRRRLHDTACWMPSAHRIKMGYVIILKYIEPLPALIKHGIHTQTVYL